MNDVNSVRDSTVVLSDAVIRNMLALDETVRLVEEAFAQDALGHAVALPVVVCALDEFNAHFGIKSGYLKSHSPRHGQPTASDDLSKAFGDVLGLKVGGYWLGNPSIGLPGHRATMVLLYPNTGYMLALLSANWITRQRTAAVSAIAAKYLARENSRVATVIGAGDQAHAQLEALRLERRIQKVYVWARNPNAAEKYAATWKDRGVDVEAVRDIRAATEKADVIITTTPSTEALVHNDAVRPGTHITAVGSDVKGKQELDVPLLQRAKVVVDKMSQSLEIGELQHAVKQGLDAKKMVYAELGELCAGLKPGRTNDQEITVLDSSGVSFQDLVVADYLVRRAKSENLGQYVSL